MESPKPPRKVSTPASAPVLPLLVACLYRCKMCLLGRRCQTSTDDNSTPRSCRHRQHFHFYPTHPPYAVAELNRRAINANS